MEIRGMNGAELGWAVKLVHEIYETCVREKIATEQEVQQFYNYVRAENLWQEMTAGRLFVWGVWEGETLCGVSAMQNVGHFTMLYIHPDFQNQGYGTALLHTMTNYAAQCLRLGQVTVNVTPVSAAPFFYHRGFSMIPGGIDYAGFVSLVRPVVVTPGGNRYVVYPQQSQMTQQTTQDRVTYQKRTVNGGVIALLICVVLGILLFGTVILSLFLV